MVAGRFEVRPTVASVVGDVAMMVGHVALGVLSGAVGGWSPSLGSYHLFFDGDGKSVMAVEQSAEGFFCRSCRTALMLGAEPAEPSAAADGGGIQAFRGS
jgi:hypothetical protein